MSEAIAPPSRPRRPRGLPRPLRGGLGTVWRGLAPTRGRIAYLLRVFGAIAIALGLSAWLQLRNPQAAVTTVLIVVNPSVGALVSKSVWRIVGTLLGATAAVVAFAAFSQSVPLFFCMMAVWVGLCCVASTLLRYFRAYGAVLAGYTLVIVAAPSYADPESILLGALSRLSAVVIGIVVAGSMFLLTTRQPRAAALLARVRGLAAAAAGLLNLSAAAPGDPEAHARRIDAGRQALTAGVAAADEQLEFQPAADPRVRAVLVYLRLSCARLLGTVSGTAPIARMAAWLAPFEAIDPQARPLAARLEAEAAAQAGAAFAAVERLRDDPANASDLAAAHDSLARVEARLQKLTAQLAAAPPTQDPTQTASVLRALATIDLLGLLLGRIRDVVDALAELSGIGRRPLRPRDRAPIRLRFFLDWRTALRNGVRGALATLLCCWFWYLTEWPEGPSLLAYVIPAASLLATAPSAGRAAREFAVGTVLSALGSSFAVAVLLPQAVGFWQIVLAICLMTGPALWVHTDPRWGRIATGYLIFFSAQLGVQNPLRLNIEAALNASLAFIFGAAMVVLVFSVLLPPNDLREARRLSRTLVRSVERCARPVAPWQRYLVRDFNRGAVWEHWHIQVVGRLMQRIETLPPPLRRDIADGAMSSVILGRAVLRLHDLRQSAPAQAHAPIGRMLTALRRLSRDPAAVARDARAASFAMPLDLAGSAQEAPSDDPRPRTPHRVAATLRQIGELLAAYPDFYDRAGPLQALFADAGTLRVVQVLPAERVA